MKTAVIYYSYEGSTSLVAETIRTALGSDIFEIKTAKEYKKRKGFAKYFWGGAQVIFNKKPALRPLQIDIGAYELIILGTPVWAGSPTPPIVSFLSGTKITGKKVALFCCHVGEKRKVFDKLKVLLPGNTFAGEIDFINAARGDPDELKKKIGEWAKTIGA